MAGFTITTLLNFPSILKTNSENQSLRDRARAIEYQSLHDEIDRDAAKAKIEEGCNIALDATDRTKYADLKNGTIVDAADGTRVCSRKGEFGVVKGGKLTQVISAGQPKDVKEFAMRVYSGSVKIKTQERAK